METMHSLLKRQLRRHLGDSPSIPPEWQAFINGVNDAYREFDTDRGMLEHSLELSSQELFDANSEMRAVFQAIPDLVLRLNHQGTILDIKAGTGGGLMLKRQDWIGKQIQDTLPADVAAQLLEAVRRVIQENAPTGIEYSTLLQGQEFHWEARLVPLLETQIVVIVRDITARKHAEQRLQEDMLTLQRATAAAQAITQHQTLAPLLQELAVQARAVVQAHQCFVRLLPNRSSFEAGSGISLSDKYADWHARVNEPDSLEVGIGIDAAVCEANLPMRLTQARLQAHPRWRMPAEWGHTRPPMRGWLAIPLKSRSGENVGLLEFSDKCEGEFTQQDQYVVEQLAQIASAAIENVNLLEEIRQLNTKLELKVVDRAEALARQEALFHAAADQAPQVMWIVNTKGAVTYLNRFWYELVGGASPKWYGHEWAEVVHPEDVAEMWEKWESVSQSREVFTGVRRVRATDGSYHILSYRASPVLDSHGEVTCWIGMDTDITEIKAIEAALRLSNRELEAFSYSVSHDLRAPLKTIDGFSQLLAKQLSADDRAKVHHYMSRIRNGVAHMSQLIESLLALAQVSRNTLQPVPLDLSDIAATVFSELQAREPDRQITVVVEPGLLVEADEGLLFVAMENLLGNAWKFTSRRNAAEIAVGRHQKAGAEDVFFVSDNGAGFDMAYADKLFGAFQRLHSVTEFPGTGVGLATVSRVIARHGGRIWAESQPGIGTTFFFTLPRSYSTGEKLPGGFALKNDSRFGALG
ncbi:MAG: PAS domain-containing protein [Pseudomonadota bacterium]